MNIERQRKYYALFTRHIAWWSTKLTQTMLGTTVFCDTYDESYDEARKCKEQRDKYIKLRSILLEVPNENDLGVTI